MKIEEQKLGVENGVRILFKKWAKREPTQQELDELKDVKTVAETEARIICMLAKEAYLSGKKPEWIEEGEGLRRFRKELRRSQMEETLKIFTDTATMEVFFRLPTIRKSDLKERDSVVEGIHYQLSFKNSLLEFNQKDMLPEKVCEDVRLAAKVFLFILYQLSLKGENLFTVDANEYFSFYGLKRQKKTIEGLKRGLDCLVALHFTMTTKVASKLQRCEGRMGYKLIYNVTEEGDQTSTLKEIEIYANWAGAILLLREENSQFILMDKKLTQISGEKARVLGIKLAQRYRNNDKNRRGEWEYLKVSSIVKDLWQTTDKDLKKNPRRYKKQLEDAIGQLEDHYEIYLEEKGSWLEGRLKYAPVIQEHPMITFPYAS